VTGIDPILTPEIMRTLGAPPDAESGSVHANGIVYATRAWGDPDAPSVLLIHGVTSSARVWWRVGPALAVGLGRRVIAIDQAGHGFTRTWLGHHDFRENAIDLLAAIDAAGIRQPGLRVVGHSWGGITAAWFPAIGLETEVIVLLDPPALPLDVIATMLDDPIERRYDDLAEAVSVLGELNPAWGYGDVVAKAEALTQFDVDAVRAILLENGDFDGGLAALSDRDAIAARRLVRIVRGDPATGGLIPDEAAGALERRVGAGNVVTIVGGSHSPMRHLAEATTAALLRALTP
jgi:pimeloyl-ACP methyl ester carboxylesterase